MMGRKKRVVGKIIWGPKKGHIKENGAQTSAVDQPSVYHALVIIFLEFFAWGLLTSPIIEVLNDTFPNHTFLLNGLIQGVKGMLSFLSAPLIGALSDVWGRKPFLLLTVSFTCLPIPLMIISPMWYFALLSLSGVFAVTFSVVFAYVADITTDEDRGQAYGLVSATFAASLVTSPALGFYLEKVYSSSFVVWLATAIALLDILFILVAVPESLPEKLRPASWGSQISWDKADPFGALRKIGHDKLILLLCITVFLSYLPEAGEYSCFFVYLRLIMHFTRGEVASYIALVGVLSVVAQTLILALLLKYLGHKGSIMYGLVFEIVQLACYGFGSQDWVIWMAGCIAAMSSVCYPAISSFVSSHASPDQQGVAQGVITGIRGLCNGLGPALFGFIFFLFHVDLDVDTTDPDAMASHTNSSSSTYLMLQTAIRSVVPGPPFAFGAILVIMALLVAIFMPENPHSNLGKSKRNNTVMLEAFHPETSHVVEAEPLITESSQNL
ncbi:hypothetical protein FSP39_006678 [Pinctada imbricata]|uniref:Major facilitator superfamily (MFS) profile domain-containing protein n=1 Tax=Pinctada imbricata TaxID=66713 RepID=A0AA88Y5A6_PINIB|nr:hypothetical protein FSP39_006678 [Pinctada imbricata]